MRPIRTSELAAGVKLLASLYHEGGAPLHKAGEVLTALHKSVLERCGISEVYQAGPGEQENEVRAALSRHSVSPLSAPEGSILAEDAFTPHGALVLRKGAAIDAARQRVLLRQGVALISIEKREEEGKSQQLAMYREVLQRLARDSVSTDLEASCLAPTGEPAPGHAAPPAQARRRPGAGIDRGERGLKILIADDDAQIRRLVRRLLQEEGYAVVEASDGLSARSVLSRERVDLILLDHIMPHMGGAATAEFVTVWQREKGIPTILFTGTASGSELEAARATGAADCISKPFVTEVLLAKVAWALQER